MDGDYQQRFCNPLEPDDEKDMLSQISEEERRLDDYLSKDPLFRILEEHCKQWRQHRRGGTSRDDDSLDMLDKTHEREAGKGKIET